MAKSDFNRVKRVLEGLVAEDRFNGNSMYANIDPIVQASYPRQTKAILDKLGQKNYLYVITSMLRNVFLIELVNDDISSTWVEVRWSIKKSAGKKQEPFDSSDPRFCEFEDCRSIFEKLLDKLVNDVQDSNKVKLLAQYAKYAILSYEVPLDYVKVPKPGTTERIHYPGNLDWIWDEKYRKTIELREALLSQTNSLSVLFGTILKDKVKVKTYLTDRVQTGVHKTNREKRWEVHPGSVHFALRKECLLVERKLMSQLCYFDGFPQELFSLVKDKIIAEKATFRDPVTLEVLPFAEFKKQIMSPQHGKSDFHVGHLNPLKLSSADRASGHTSENIAWFSHDGNRIQGSLSIEETRRMLARIVKNYTDANRRNEIGLEAEANSDK